MAKRDFLSLLDASPEELGALVDRAIELKRMLADGVAHQPLAGQTAAIIFQLKSTRTRVAFETGVFQLGGQTIFLSDADTQLGRGEPIADTARVLSEMVDLVAIRTLDHAEVETFAGHASVPVINAMTSLYHPCQLLADVQTFVELRGPITGATVAFIGDGYNMCNSYINAARQWGFNLKIACPPGHQPDPALVATTNNATLAESPEAAVENADLVVTDVWSSMGHEAQEQSRRQAFDGYQVDARLLDAAPADVLFMHCLPAHRGEEISQNLFEDRRSVVWQEAGNRLHSSKALVEWLLGWGRPNPDR